MAGFNKYQARDENGQWTAGSAKSAIQSAASDKVYTMPKSVFTPGMNEDEKFTALQELIADLPTVEEKIDAVEDQIRYQDYESMAVFDKYGDLMLFKDGEHNQVEVEPNEEILIKSEGAVLTHNHPRDISFSNGDLYTTESMRLPEMRAVSASNDYILRPNYDYEGEGNWMHGKLGAAYDETLKDVVSDIFNALENGEMKQETANKIFQHESIKRFAEATGSKYIVIPNKIPIDIPRERLKVPEYDFKEIKYNIGI